MFDIVEELVLTLVVPTPAHAFAIDHDVLAQMPTCVRAIMSGAAAQATSTLTD